MTRTVKEFKNMEFKTIVREVGNSGHILLPKNWVGKEVHVIIRLEEE